MTQDEIATMDGGKCILQVRGEAVFLKKYDITKHPRYKYLSDADKKTALMWRNTSGRKERRNALRR